MAKITLPSIASGYNPATINSNFQLIASALNDRVLYRVNVGTEPNQMINMLDMNNFRIINLPEPLTDTEPFRKKDGTIFSGQMDAKVAQAQAYAVQAGGYATQAANSASQAASEANRATQQANRVINEGIVLQLSLLIQGTVQVNNAKAYADSSLISAQNAQVKAQESALSAVQSGQYATDSANSAAEAQSIADSLAGGTIGFDAVAYDFGSVTDASTYFNRDFGTIV